MPVPRRAVPEQEQQQQDECPGPIKQAGMAGRALDAFDRYELAPTWLPLPVLLPRSHC